MSQSAQEHYRASALQKIAAMYIPCIAYTAILITPMTFSAIIERFNVNAAAATPAVTIEIGCIALASLFVSLALGALRPRLTIMLGLVLAIVGQLLTLSVTDFNTVIGTRALTGIGEGLLIGMGMASLAQMQGGTKLLAYVSGLISILTVIAFLVVPAINEAVDNLAIFWVLAVGLGVALPLGVVFPAQKIERIVSSSSFMSIFSFKNMSLFLICLISSIGSNTCWLYFEQVGAAAGLDATGIGHVGSISMAFCILVPFAANFIFARCKSVLPIAMTCALLAFTSWMFIVPNASVFLAVGISMNFLYVFLVAYARMYSADYDSSGRATSAVGSADSLGMVLGPLIVAQALNLEGGFVPLGQFGVMSQLICIIPAILVLYRSRSNNRSVSAI